MAANWQGKRVVIIGAARQGTALARYLVGHGASVVVNDRRQAAELQAVQKQLEAEAAGSAGCLEFVFGDHPLHLLDGADLVCPSGGVPLTLPLVAEAQARHIPLSNDSQIFLEAAPCPVIGITGSAGKTTTTTLVGRMADAEASARPGVKAYTGGNIGSPLISVVDHLQPTDLVVMELSSFQLEIMTRSTQVAAILNITPNHLDRHASMEEYTASKARIFTFQGSQGVAVLGRDDPGAWALAPTVPGRVVSFGFSPLPPGHTGTYIEDGWLYWSEAGSPARLTPRSDIALRGDHNTLNVLAACAIAASAGFSVDAMLAGVQGFYGVPHRLELVRQLDGVQWFNDSIATAPERAAADIRSFDEPLVLLAGGRDKNLPWGEFAELVHRRVDHLVVFGEAAGIIRAAIESVGPLSSQRLRTLVQTGGLQEAVQAAHRLAEPGCVVLLSPGGTSFDEFRDFEHRGEAFRRWVMELP